MYAGWISTTSPLTRKRPRPSKRVVADVLDVDELAQHQVAVLLLAHVDDDDALLVLLRRAEAVDAGDRGDDDHVAAREQRTRWRSGAAGRCRRSARSPSRCRGRPGGRTPPAGSSRSRRRSTRPRCRGRTRGTRCRAGRRASCCGRSRAPVDRSSRSSTPSSPSCRCPSRRRSVWKRSPAARPDESASIARGWSPVGRYAADVFSAATRGHRVTAWSAPTKHAGDPAA